MGIVAWLLMGMMTVALAAAEIYVVPAQSAVIEADFPGFVEADRGRLQAILPQAENLIITWCGENGRPAVPGERITVFDASVIERDVPQKQAEAAGAEATYRLELLRLDQTQAALEDQGSQARAQLATVRAQIAALGSDAVGTIALARAYADMATAEVATAERAARRLRVQAAAGDATAQVVAAAEQAVAMARLNQARAEAAWHIEETHDRSIERERLRLQEIIIMGQLGLQRRADGSEYADPALGFSGRLLENKTRRIAQETSLAGERDMRIKAAHEALRDSHDHTPWSWIAVRPVGSGLATAVRWNFTIPSVPEEQTSPLLRVDHGEVYTPERGWGWDRDVRNRLAQGADHTWILVREQATWRCRLPDGRYLVTLGMGADSDWDGALVRLSGTGDATAAILGHVSNRIAGGSWPSEEREITIRGGELMVIVGDEVAKTLRVTTAGMILLHQRTERGRKTQWLQRPVAYIAEPMALRINGRIPQESAALLSTSETATATADSDPRLACATHEVRVFAPGQSTPMPGLVIAVGSKPVGTAINEQGWNEQDQANPQDLGAREVSVSLTAGDALRLRVRTSVLVHLTSQPPAGIWALAPWLVVSRESKSWVYERRQGFLEISAQRAGAVVLVRGLSPGMELQVPRGAPEIRVAALAISQDRAAADAGKQVARFAGEVITGVRTRMTMGSAWGRVATFIPDGTDVGKGDEVLTLYNPWIDEKRDSIKRERENANRAFQEAVAARRERLLAAGEQRRQDVVAEGNARLDVADASKADEQLPVAVIDYALAVSTRQYTAAVVTATAGLAAPGQATLAEARTAARRAELLAKRSELARSQQARSADWLAMVSSAGAWGEALAVLGQRERKAELIRAEDRAEVMKSRASLDQMLQGQAWITGFEHEKVLHATAVGRLYWLQAWNDQTRAMGKVTRDVLIWDGTPVAEIVDLSQLSFRAEVPEPWYPHLAIGQAVMVCIPGLGDLRLPAAISSIGQALSQPRDARAAGDDAPVADQRVFSVTVMLTLPVDQRGRLVPGMRGVLELPDHLSPASPVAAP